MRWYFAQGDERRGPFTLEQLLASRPSADTLVWRPGMAEWQPASQVIELAVPQDKPPQNNGPNSSSQRGTAPHPHHSGNPPAPPQTRPLWLRCIIPYALLINPTVWCMVALYSVVDWHVELSALNRGELAADIIALGIGAIATIMMYIGGRQLDRHKANGAFWIISSVVGNFTLKLLLALLLVWLAGDQEEDPLSVVTWLVLLVLLGCLVFELSASLALLVGYRRLKELEAANKPTSPSSARYLSGKALAISMATLAGTVIAGFILLLVRGSSPSNMLDLTSSSNGLHANQLPLVAQSPQVAWTIPGLFSNTDSGSSGSSVVLGQRDGYLILLTNRHVLSLNALADQGLFGQGIGRYQISVIFPTGKTAAVKQFAIAKNGLDLALLAVDPAGLVEGNDYIRPPYNANLLPQQGDETVAVGSPAGLHGTMTYGRISALREGDNPQCKYIQTDAALNPGNSGGPLFIQRDSRYYWCGINTMYVNNPSLSFAIRSEEVQRCEFLWYSADPSGATAALASFPAASPQ